MVRSSFFAGIFVLLVAVPAHADDQDRAARAFDSGQKAFAAAQYCKAATSFEEAYAAAPHTAALFNAGKARVKCGEFARAATLFAKVEAEASSPRDRDDARHAREEILPKVGRVQVTGTFDTAAVDGEPVLPSGPSYVEPGEHVVTARGVRKVVKVSAGETTVATLDGPAPTVPPPPVIQPLPPPKTDEHASRSGLPRVLTFVLGGATLVAGGVATWSGIDTLHQKSRFTSTADAAAANRQLDDGLSKQTRTNVLLGVTAGLFVVTGVVALFLTDWR